jgi:peptidyl-prolyl cis-trans isomerase C
MSAKLATFINCSPRSSITALRPHPQRLSLRDSLPPTPFGLRRDLAEALRAKAGRSPYARAAGTRSARYARWAGFCIILLLVGCAEELPRESRVVLTIAGRPVTLGEFDHFIRMSVQQESPVLSSEVMSGLFEQFIEEQLLLRAADDAGIQADPKVLAQRMAALQKVTDANPSDASSPPVEIRTTDEAVAENLERQVRIERLVSAEALAGVEIEEGEIAEYYDAHHDDFVRPETVDVSQILVNSEELARELRKTILAKKATFEDVARERSQGPEAPNGGRLGAFARGELPPSFDAAVFALKPGTISDVVSTDFGFHLFRVDSRTEEHPLSLEDVRETVRVELLREKSEAAMRRYVAELERRYPLTIHREELSFAVARRDESAKFQGSSEGMEKIR